MADYVYLSAAEWKARHLLPKVGDQEDKEDGAVSPPVATAVPAVSATSVAAAAPAAAAAATVATTPTPVPTPAPPASAAAKVPESERGMGFRWVLFMAVLAASVSLALLFALDSPILAGFNAQGTIYLVKSPLRAAQVFALLFVAFLALCTTAYLLD